MSFHRFEDLNHFLQINSDLPNNLPAVQKLQPLIDLSKKFKNYYTPSYAISIDESMCPFRGRFKYLVYEPKKPKKWGIKLINESDAATGYCLGITPYLGKETYLQDKEVKTLELIIQRCKEYEKGNHFYCDNFYCHPNLAIKIKQSGQEMTGTIRVTRKDVPQKFEESKVKRGEAKAFQHEEGVFLIKYHDKRKVNLLTTRDSLCIKEYNSARGKSYKRPQVITNYVQRMRGVDKLNQLSHYYR